jgi:hypothetical protein
MILCPKLVLQAAGQTRRRNLFMNILREARKVYCSLLFPRIGHGTPKHARPAFWGMRDQVFDDDRA